MDPSGGILTYVVNKLGDAILSEAALLGNTRRDLEWVQKELGAMLAFLEDAANVQPKEAIVERWIEEVREMAFRAEDIVDTLSLHIGDATPESSLPGFLSRWRHDFGTQIAELKEDVDDFKRRKETYDIKFLNTRSAGTVERTDDQRLFRRLRAAPYTEDRDVVGLERHVKAVTGLLVHEGSRRSVVSIVGMGGLGKTTLAKKVYKLLQSSSSFEYTAWVDVSQKYTLLDLLGRILKPSMVDGREMNEEARMARLREVLLSKKYLIVLDDVWTPESWKMLNDILPDPNNGSRIIITTRQKKVASSANPSVYELPLLGEDEGLRLFTKKVFPDKENSEQYCSDKGLTRLRKEIVRKCGGLPLAIIVVAGLLSTIEESPVAWRKVAEKIDWYQEDTEGQCMKILALSYIDLPIHLKWCFLYLGAIPENCEASAQRLMLLWIAEGFVKEEDGVSMEERAERYLEELAQRCLIQVVEEYKYWKDERKCRVHDLILELAVKEAKKIRFLDVWRSAHERSPRALMRRLSYTADKEKRTTTLLPLGSNKLRTLLIMDRTDWHRLNTYYLYAFHGNIKWPSLQRNLKLVRVLEIALDLDELTEEIGDMVNLRYLSLSGNITKLPESLGKLRHLQTLNVGETKVDLFPESIWQIKTLRNLTGRHTVEDYASTRLPIPKTYLGTNVFENMRTLRLVHADPWMETILPSLIHLEALDILDVDQDSMSSYLSSTLKKLQKLETFYLASRLEEKAIFNIDEIFSQTQYSHTYIRSVELYCFRVVSSQLGRLPQNLARVRLFNAEIDHNVLELLGNLKYLRHLELGWKCFTEDAMVFKSGWFPQLRFLRLIALDIKRWVLEGRSLPLLRELKIYHCPYLKELPEELLHIDTLKEFSLGGGSSLKESLKRREGADWDKVKHIEHVYL